MVNLKQSCARIFLVTAALALPLANAVAQPRQDWQRGHDHRDYHGHGGYNYHGHGGNNVGAAIGGALLGLGVGALVGGALAQQAAAPPPGAYYPPPPPGPGYGPPPGAYYP